MYNATPLAKTDPAHRQELLGARTVTGCALTLLILWTLLGNFTVCAAVIRYRHLRTKVTNIFIVSLALSDLLVAVLVMPWKAVAEVTGFWPFGAFCDTWVACDIMCSTASILNLCIISLDRYWAISSPFRYMRKMNNKVAYVMIGVTWTVSVVISFVPVQLHWHRAEIDDLTGELAGYNITHPGGDTAVGINCNSSLNRTYAISSSLISFYIPVAIMVVTYTRIYRIAQVHIRRISSQERAVEHAQSCRSDAHALAPHRFPKSHEQHHNPHHHHHYQQNNHHYNNHHLHHYNSQRALRTSIRKETKVLKTLSVIMGAFICCWFPFFVLNCAVPFCPGPESPDTGKGPLCVSEKTFDVFVWIGWSNSSLNPIIYAFNADFRDAFLRLLGCRRGERWSVMSTAVETMVASNEAGSHTQDRSLSTDMGVVYVSGVATNTVRVSEDDGDTVIRTLPLFHRRDTITDNVCDNEDCKTDGDLGLKCVDTHPLTIIN